MVMALGYRQNLVSAQYLVNEFMEFNHFAFALTLIGSRLGLLQVIF